MLVQKEIKRNHTFRLPDSTVKMLNEIKQQTGISQSEIIGQFIKSYYTTKNLELNK